MKSPDWSGSSGDIWARRWRDTDRALQHVGAALDQAIAAAASAGPFRALDVGCGPGTTSLGLAGARADATILGCDLSEALVEIARERAAGLSDVSFVAEDAEKVALEHAPFDLVFSRHGVMFFDDPSRAFRTFRAAVTAGASLVFSCFRAWEANPWAAELASAAAGFDLPAPGREPSGFAFANPAYVGDILTCAGWIHSGPQALDFDYVAGESPGGMDQAMDFLLELGPASRVIEELDGSERAVAAGRVRRAVERYAEGGRVVFPAAAWIWAARAE